MFRVRNPKGVERSYESSAELAQAISLGEVGHGFEVFHSRTGTWLPVETHPAYQTFLAASGAGVIEPPTPAVPDPAPPRTERDAIQSRAGKLRTMLALAGGIVVIGLGTEAYPALKARFESPAGPAVAQAPALPPAEADPWNAPVRPSDPLPLDRPADPDTMAAPAGSVTSRMAATRVAISPAYSEGYDAARRDVREGLEYVAFDGLWRPSRLNGPDSLRATRRRIVAAQNLVAAFRGQELMLEESYRASITDSASSLREPFASAEAGRQVLAAADTLVGLVLAQGDQVTVRGSALRFADARAAAAYDELRAAFLTALESAALARPTFTLGLLLPALRNPTPPVPQP